MDERNLDIQNSTENIKKQYSAEDMKREFEAIKEEWIKKKINLSELTDKMSEKISEVKESSAEYCKFLYYITGIVKQDSNVEKMYNNYFTIIVILFTIIEMMLHIIEISTNSVVVHIVVLLAYFLFIILTLAPRLKNVLFSFRERTFYHILNEILLNNRP